jgi:hypothetical protein
MASTLHAVGSHVCYRRKTGAAIGWRYDTGELAIPTDRNLQSLTQYQVLAGRLGTAQLLEDRRASIAGIRSLAKQYPASGKLQSSSEWQTLFIGSILTF